MRMVVLSRTGTQDKTVRAVSPIVTATFIAKANLFIAGSTTLDSSESIFIVKLTGTPGILPGR